MWTPVPSIIATEQVFGQHQQIYSHTGASQPALAEFSDTSWFSEVHIKWERNHGDSLPGAPFYPAPDDPLEDGCEQNSLQNPVR